MRLGGSPPRVWGKRLRGEGLDFVVRFTPTRVGKTRLVTPPGGVVRFTPTRVGKTQQRRRQRAAQRFTPTRVGKTQHSAQPPGAPAVHPHACGENRRINPGLVDMHGSPPRVWGKRVSRGAE